jgi:hypothetical protein
MIFRATSGFTTIARSSLRAIQRRNLFRGWSGDPDGRPSQARPDACTRCNISLQKHSLLLIIMHLGSAPLCAVFCAGGFCAPSSATSAHLRAMPTPIPPHPAHHPASEERGVAWLVVRVSGCFPTRPLASVAATLGCRPGRSWPVTQETGPPVASRRPAHGPR